MLALAESFSEFFEVPLTLRSLQDSRASKSLLSVNHKSDIIRRSRKRPNRLTLSRLESRNAVTDYYKVLGVRRTASKSEVKSAYRKLARLRHPDLNGGSEGAAREFDLLSKAYRVLIDPQERAYYDNQLSSLASNGGSILSSSNPHARRARDIAMQARWDRVVDEVLERDRQETRERQRAVFTIVSLVSLHLFCGDDPAPLLGKFQFRRTRDCADLVCDRRLAPGDQTSRVSPTLHLSKAGSSR